ncbi:MAG: hypothetical protein CJBNEKGG_01764 [Prosthecobacter sp.]|nr:hypothetical protein [Prosthecobacter sp.]
MFHHEEPERVEQAKQRSGQSGKLKRPRTPEAIPAGASLLLISAERDGHFAGAILAAFG